MSCVLSLHAMKWAGFGAGEREWGKTMFSGEKSYCGGKSSAVLLLATPWTGQQQYSFVGKFRELRYKPRFQGEARTRLSHNAV